MSARIKVVLADDHALLRETLRRWMSDAADFEVVASVGDADAGLEAAIRHDPNLVLLDIDMPGRHSFEVAATIKRRCPNTRVVFLSAFCHDRYIEQALAAGASGYLTKSEPPEKVLAALRRVAGGMACFSPEVEARIVVDSDGVRLNEATVSRSATLTSREIEILRYLARGLSKKEVAQYTNLSERTVNRHCVNLMAKLDIHDRVDLARYAIREGLSEP